MLASEGRPQLPVINNLVVIRADWDESSDYIKTQSDHLNMIAEAKNESTLYKPKFPK